LADVSMRAIPVKYIASVDLQLSNKGTYTIDVSKKLKKDWYNNIDEASMHLEQMINEIHETTGVDMVEYILDFDLMRAEISFTSSRLGNENNSDND
jgi:hypothetical protein